MASAPGKIILFGEHAAVYGRPAIAAPIPQLRATAVVQSAGRDVVIIAPDLGISHSLADAPDDDPLTAVLRIFQRAANLPTLPPLTITVSSPIPIAGGLGSGAAISAAMLRALTAYFDLPSLATDEQICRLTYEAEKIHHGTPSGIDNTVVTYEKLVYFARQSPQNRIQLFKTTRPLPILIADTGIRSGTKAVVEEVARQRENETAKFDRLFDECGDIAQAARAAIESGNLREIGRLMTNNHSLLQEMTVSSPELDKLTQAATAAGAMGAKLSGAGRGGNMIALIGEDEETAVRQALLNAGAKTVLKTVIQ